MSALVEKLAQNSNMHSISPSCYNKVTIGRRIQTQGAWRKVLGALRRIDESTPRIAGDGWTCGWIFLRCRLATCLWLAWIQSKMVNLNEYTRCLVLRDTQGMRSLCLSGQGRRQDQIVCRLGLLSTQGQNGSRTLASYSVATILIWRPQGLRMQQ
jgi:hypothetical protein